MLLPFIALILGCVIGIYVPWSINPSYSVYVAIAILAALDSVLGGISANLSKRFSMIIFISGLFGNAALAAKFKSSYGVHNVERGGGGKRDRTADLLDAISPI